MGGLDVGALSVKGALSRTTPHPQPLSPLKKRGEGRSNKKPFSLYLRREGLGWGVLTLAQYKVVLRLSQLPLPPSPPKETGSGEKRTDMKDNSPRMVARARRLRQEPTKSEMLFWERVRGGQILGFKFRRQVPIAGIVVDFACLSANLVIEIDGGVHNDPAQIQKDRVRDARLDALGFDVLRFGVGAIYHDLEAVIFVIRQYLTGEG